jgi:hypothetical protein
MSPIKNAMDNETAEAADDKVRRNYRFDPKTVRYLEALKAETGSSETELVRQGIRLLAKQRKIVLP